MSSAELDQLKHYLGHMPVVPIMSRTQAKTAIDAYFNAQTWSLLKEEWGKMSHTEKMAFADKLWKEVR